MTTQALVVFAALTPAQRKWLREGGRAVNPRQVRMIRRLMSIGVVRHQPFLCSGDKVRLTDVGHECAEMAAA